MKLKPEKVEWVVNDNTELGVKIGNQFFFLYKGRSLEYEEGIHDDGSPMKWRHVFKREFGECCHPWTAIELKEVGKIEPNPKVRLPDNFIGYFGEDENEWKVLPQSPTPEGEKEKEK